jgi:hypothetical protein
MNNKKVVPSAKAPVKATPKINKPTVKVVKASTPQPKQKQVSAVSRKVANIVKKDVKTVLKNSAPVKNPSFHPMKSGTSAPVGASAGKWMNEHNPYLATLQDPVHCPGAKIPDGNMNVTSTMQVIYHTQVTSGSAGIAGVLLGECGTSQAGPYLVPQADVSCAINSVGGTGAVTEGALGLKTQPAATGTSMNSPFSESTTFETGSVPFAIPGLAPFLASNTQYARLVSAALSLRSTSNFTNNQGYFVAGSLPCRFFEEFGSFLADIPVDDFQNSPGAITKPINDPDNNGIQCTYNPFDSRTLSFVDTQISGNTDPATDKIYQLNPGILFAMAIGVPTAQVMLVDLAINYEIVPISGTINFGARASYDDPLALATAKNARQGDSLVQPSTDFDSSGYGEDVVDSLLKTQHSFAPVPRVKTVEACASIHFLNCPVKINRLGNKNKRSSKSMSVTKAKNSQSGGLFESAIGALFSLAKKAAPMIGEGIMSML